MTYQLQSFNKIIHGELNPMSNSGFRIINASSELQSLYKEYREKFIISFQPDESGSYKLIDQRSYAFADLIQFPLQNEEDYERDAKILDMAKAVASMEMSLDNTRMRDLKYQRTKDKIHLHFEIEYDWKELSTSKAIFHYINHLLTEEVNRIKESFFEKMFSLTNEEALKLYVQNYQNEIILLIDSCLYQLKDNAADKVYQISTQYTSFDILKITFYYLENLLLYLEGHFNKYLDLRAKIPYRHKMITVYEMKSKVERLFNQINQSIAYPLAELIFEPLDKLTNINTNLSYQQLIYLRNFTNSLIKKSEQKDYEWNDASLISFLEEQNFNSLRFCQYLINSFNQDLGKVKSLHKRQQLLHDLLRRYNQLPVTNDSYIDSLPSLKDQMLGWINEELYIAYRKYDNNFYGSSRAEQINSKAKLPINLSVAQMAYLMKVEKELNLFPINNVSEMTRIFCENTSSVRQENISPSSIWSKYYNVEHSTKLAVRDTIKKMLDYVNKDISE